MRPAFLAALLNAWREAGARRCSAPLSLGAPCCMHQYDTELFRAKVLPNMSVGCPPLKATRQLASLLCNIPLPMNTAATRVPFTAAHEEARPEGAKECAFAAPGLLTTRGERPAEPLVAAGEAGIKPLARFAGLGTAPQPDEAAPRAIVTSHSEKSPREPVGSTVIPTGKCSAKARETSPPESAMPPPLTSEQPSASLMMNCAGRNGGTTCVNGRAELSSEIKAPRA